MAQCGMRRKTGGYTEAEMSTKRFYITTAISYPNGRPHMGHAYELIATDVIARFKRLDGFEVFFLTGTDEHGQKMLQTARRENMTAHELADRNSAVFREMADKLNASNDDFIRTTEERHFRTTQELWRRMVANGDIYKGAYAGWYSVRYFFRLSNYTEPLLRLYEANPGFVAPESRRNEVTSFVRQGLRDLSVSRTTFDWGIPVPGDEKHVMYVWVDALTNYVTATGWPEEHERNAFWPADVHVIGKDIVRFHAVYWPAFLMSAGLPVPKRVFGHGFLFNKGEKMSKSVGNVLDPFNLADSYGVDQMRYFFLREVPFGNDGSYSHEAIVARINADLANDLGNLAQRSLSMIAKNCEGRVPAKGQLAEPDEGILSQARGVIGEAREAIDQQQIHRYLDAVWAVVADANRYFAAQEPWVLRKTDPARMETVLWTTAELIRNLAILIQPVMPESAAKLLDQLSVAADRRGFAEIGEGGELLAGTGLPAPQGVFPRWVEPEQPAAQS